MLDCIVTIDHEGRITEFNPAAEHAFGCRRDEVLGRALADVMIPPSLRERHRQGLARYLATGETRVIGKRIEMTAMRADGSEFPVELTITRIPSDGPPSFTGYLRDITQRKRSEEELRRSQAFLAETRRLSSTGGFYKRIATGEIIWSEEVYRIFEFDPAAPLTLERILTRVHPDDIHSFNEMLDRQQRGANYEQDYRLLMPDNSIKYLHVVAHATRDQDGQPEYMAAVQDVTQRRLSEEALAKARSELAHVARVTTLGALTASIAHEVNQPLAGIITNASTCLRMLAADPPNVDGARETARRTIRDGNRASEVITRLRALFSKKNASTETVDLNEAAREVVALSLSELQRSQVILRQELADDLPPVTGDRVQLQQVILNLLLNAADAMRDINDRPRLLVIRTERDTDDHVRLSVQDAGVGFEPQAVAKLFDAFYTTKSGGMGIGLSVSRSIIESHHGRLWAAPNDGPGATFSFSIPRRSEDVFGDQSPNAIWTSAVTDDAAGREEALMTTHSLVSVVDDDESVRESLPDLLREFGFAVQAFSSAEEFLASDYVGQTKCLILDIAMPGMSGPVLQQELTLRGQAIPIVFITAHGDESVRPRLLQQGAVECLFKPFSDTALLGALNAALH